MNVPSTGGWARTNAPSEGEAVTEGLTRLTTMLRWATTTFGLVLSATLSDPVVPVLAGLVLCAWALWRTFRPVSSLNYGWKSLLPITVEATITVAVIVATRCWDSPYVFSLFVTVIAAAFSRGFWHGLRFGITSALAVGAAAQLLNWPNSLRFIGAWSLELVLCAGVASYGRLLMLRADQARAANISLHWKLSQANTLLVRLNRIANDLSATFDLHETCTAALQKLDSIAPTDLIAIVLYESVAEKWTVAATMGLPIEKSYKTLPIPEDFLLTKQPRSSRLRRKPEGFHPESHTGLYVPLFANDRCTGVVALESLSPTQFSEATIATIRDVAETIALTIDNARWFERLRARGAAQERSRIARDLHDRVGQSVAFLHFELQRLAENTDTPSLRAEIQDLQHHAKAMVSELRETLHDLRTEITEELHLEEVVVEFLERVQRRSGIHTSHHFCPVSLPVSLEREVWRILQEAITNAERHAECHHISVTAQEVDGALLFQVEDDGIGLTKPHESPEESDHAEASQRGHYGLIGMFERAESIGARLQADALAEGGTRISLRVTIDGSPPAHLRVDTPAELTFDDEFSGQPQTFSPAATRSTPE